MKNELNEKRNTQRKKTENKWVSQPNDEYNV